MSEFWQFDDDEFDAEILRERYGYSGDKTTPVRQPKNALGQFTAVRVRPCGTVAGYWYHRRHKEPVDMACLIVGRHVEKVRRRKYRAMLKERMANESGGKH